MGPSQDTKSREIRKTGGKTGTGKVTTKTPVDNFWTKENYKNPVARRRGGSKLFSCARIQIPVNDDYNEDEEQRYSRGIYMGNQVFHGKGDGKYGGLTKQYRN